VVGPPGAVEPPHKKEDSINVCNDEFLKYNRVPQYIFYISICFGIKLGGMQEVKNTKF
jgi:hypothetical protein